MALDVVSQSRRDNHGRFGYPYGRYADPTLPTPPDPIVTRHPIAEAIRRLRMAGLTQSEIARRTGIPQPRISQWEAGETPASESDAIRLIELAESFDPTLESGTRLA